MELSFTAFPIGSLNISRPQETCLIQDFWFKQNITTIICGHQNNVLFVKFSHLVKGKILEVKDLTIEQLSDWIILCGGVAAALMTLYKFVAGPTTFLKKKQQDYCANHFKEKLEEEMPKMFLAHDLETREKYLADRQQYLEEIRESVLEETKDVLSELKTINLEQNKKIEILNQASKNVLRQRIMEIYNGYRDEKKMPLFVKDQLDELYKDYKNQGGNSYIDKYYHRMSLWEVYDDGEEI